MVRPPRSLSIVLAAAVGLVPALPRRLALAQPTRGVEAAPGAETVAAAGDAADDDTRFACGKPRGTFEINLADEVTVKDLVSWAMGFSCKRFVYTQGITGRSAKLTMITPGKLDAAEAWSVFEVGLEVGCAPTCLGWSELEHALVCLDGGESVAFYACAVSLIRPAVPTIEWTPLIDCGGGGPVVHRDDLDAANTRMRRGRYQARPPVWSAEAVARSARPRRAASWPAASPSAATATS